METTMMMMMTMMMSMMVKMVMLMMMVIMMRMMMMMMVTRLSLTARRSKRTSLLSPGPCNYTCSSSGDGKAAGWHDHSCAATHACIGG